MGSRTVGGKYQLGSEIGRGGFGRVYLARDLKNKQWALKELCVESKDPSQMAKVREFFDQEQKILSWLSHPSIVRRHETLSDDGRVYLVMEYVEGVTLDELLKRFPDPLPAELVVQIGEQICEILTYLHGQKPHPIIFRDLKPSNLMVDRQGQLKLIDFGIARLHNREHPSQGVPDLPPVPDGLEATLVLSARPGGTVMLGRGQDTHCLGTPGYAAPEQYPGSGLQSDQRADIYALGVMLHQLLSRESPARLKTPLPGVRSFNAAVDPELEKLLLKATSVQREQRFESASAMLRALGAFRQTRLRANPEQLKARLGKLISGVFHPPDDFGEAVEQAVQHSARVRKELAKPVEAPLVPVGPMMLATLLVSGLTFLTLKANLPTRDATYLWLVPLVVPNLLLWVAMNFLYGTDEARYQLGRLAASLLTCIAFELALTMDEGAVPFICWLVVGSFCVHSLTTGYRL